MSEKNRRGKKGEETDNVSEDSGAVGDNAAQEFAKTLERLETQRLKEEQRREEEAKKRREKDEERHQEQMMALVKAISQRQEDVEERRIETERKRLEEDRQREDKLREQEKILQERLEEERKFMEFRREKEEEDRRVWMEKQELERRQWMQKLNGVNEPEMTNGESIRLHEGKLQKLTESDDIENFLITFERMGDAYKWPPNLWTIKLAPILTGKAQAAYANMDREKAKNYQDVKAAILKRYNIN